VSYATGYAGKRPQQGGETCVLHQERQDVFYNVVELRIVSSMSKPAITIKDLFPDLSPEKEKEAEENLRRYFAFVARLYDRIVSEPHGRDRLQALTEEYRLRRMDAGRSFTSTSSDTET
jgi:hypothetical protein